MENCTHSLQGKDGDKSYCIDCGQAMPEKTVVIEYTNWRGERGFRRIKPISIDYTSTKWHPDPQWIMDALDLDRNAVRSFAMRDIHSTKTE
jgi:predicted DNA-binding transcriptional regulator YafY